jgi:hypothetical protein
MESIKNSLKKYTADRQLLGIGMWDKGTWQKQKDV